MNNVEDNKPLGLGYNIITLEALLKIFVNGYKKYNNSEDRMSCRKLIGINCLWTIMEKHAVFKKWRLLFLFSLLKSKSK